MIVYKLGAIILAYVAIKLLLYFLVSVEYRRISKREYIGEFAICLIYELLFL